MPSLNAVSSSSKIQFWYSFFAGFQFLTAQFIRKIFSWIKKEKKTPKNVTYAHDIAAKTRLFLFCNVCNNFFPFRKKKGNVKNEKRQMFVTCAQWEKFDHVIRIIHLMSLFFNSLFSIQVMKFRFCCYCRTVCVCVLKLYFTILFGWIYFS